MLRITSFVSILIGHLCILNKIKKKSCSMESVIFIFLSALNYYIKFVILSTLYSITVM